MTVNSQMIKLSDYVMQRLVAEGVRDVFMVPGGAAMHLNDSLLGNPNLNFIANYHEQASATGAEAYAKTRGGLGVALVTAGPGSTNCITGLTSAWVNSAPVLFLSGQVKSNDLKKDPSLRQCGLQEVDIVSAVRPLTKYAKTVTDPNQIREILDWAFYYLREERPGPVWIDIPLDLQAVQINPEQLQRAKLPEEKNNQKLEEVVKILVQDLQKAQRPVFLLGAGIRIGGGVELLHELLQLLKVPCLTTWVGADLLDDQDACFAGRPGAFASRGANFTVQNADLLISIGARWDFATTGFARHDFGRNAKRIIVDIDAAEVAKLTSVVDIALQADAKDFLVELIKQIPSNFSSEKYHSWRQQIILWKKKYPILTDDLRKLPERVSTYVLVEALGDALTGNEIIVQGSAGIQSEIFFMVFAVKKGQRIIADGSLGAMGYGLPAAIGAAVAGDGKETILIDGDGSLMPNLQELETVRRLNLPLKIIIVNNDGYASIRVSQERWFQRKIAADNVSGLTIPDFRKIAAAFNLPFFSITNEEELHHQLPSILNQKGPVLIDVHVPREEDRRPRLGNYQKEDGSIASKPLEDLFPFLESEELKTNMLSNESK